MPGLYQHAIHCARILPQYRSRLTRVALFWTPSCSVRTLQRLQFFTPPKVILHLSPALLRHPSYKNTLVRAHMRSRKTSQVLLPSAASSSPPPSPSSYVQSMTKGW